MKMQFQAFNTATGKRRKYRMNLEGRDQQQSFSNSVSSAGSQIFKNSERKIIFDHSIM